MNHDSFRLKIDIDQDNLPSRRNRIKSETLQLAERNRELKEAYQLELRRELIKTENDDIIKTEVLFIVLKMQSELDFNTRVVDYYGSLADERVAAWDTGDPEAIHNLQIKINTLSKIAPLEISGPTTNTAKTWYNKSNMNEKLPTNNDNYDWQAPRPTIGELPAADLRGVHAKTVHSEPNKFGREAYLHNLKQQDADTANKAKTEIHKDLQSLDLDVYSRGLERKIKTLKNNSEDAPDSDIRELELLRHKQEEVKTRLSTPDSQFAKRQAVEQERATVRRETTKINNQIKSVTAERAKLSSWNPLNWGRIRDLDKHLDTLKTREGEWQLRAKSNALQEKLFAKKAPEPENEDDFEELQTG